MVSGRRDDFELSRLILDANQDFARRVRYCPDRKTNVWRMYYCDEETNCWSRESEPFVEMKIRKCVNRLPQSTLTSKETFYVKSYRGIKKILQAVGRILIDTRFDERLDANLTNFALENLRVTVDGAHAAILPGDFIKTTAGWRYDEDLAALHRGDVALFFEQLLPVPEERKAVLAFFASSLSGVRKSKSFLALTDQRAGYNGKSALVNLMARFFGIYSEFNTRFVCAGSFQKDRDAHDAGLEPYRNTRLLVAEELKHNMNLDVALLKKLAGGSDVTVQGRRFGLAEHFSFTWRANIVLVFNEGDCPRFDGDAALLQRMLVAPMRSKFVSELPGDPEEHTFIADKNIAQQFPLWLPALLDVLRENYDPDALDSPPLSMRQWGQSVAADANPLGSWMEERVLVTGDKKDHVILSAFVTLYRADDQLRRRMDEDCFKRFAKAYLKTVALSFKDTDNIINAHGSRSNARHVAKGVLLLQLIQLNNLQLIQLNTLEHS